MDHELAIKGGSQHGGIIYDSVCATAIWYSCTQIELLDKELASFDQKNAESKMATFNIHLFEASNLTVYSYNSTFTSVK